MYDQVWVAGGARGVELGGLCVTTIGKREEVEAKLQIDAEGAITILMFASMAAWRLCV